MYTSQSAVPPQTTPLSFCHKGQRGPSNSSHVDHHWLRYDVDVPISNVI